MPRHPRLFVPGATYHVYCRVARGEFVFDDEYEAVEFVETLRGVRDLDGWTIFAWCLMGNHFHLVLKTRNVDLWRSMARLQGTVSRRYNRRHGYLGRLWQSRYRARVITSDDYFRQVVAYVHLNPVAAGIVDDLSSRLRGSRLIDGRIELIALGLSRYSLRARDFATVLDKHGATVTRWLNEGLRRERDDPTFQQRLDDLDRAISDDRHNATMRNVAP